MILFKDIKQNYPVYILNTQDMTLSQGKATAVSFPRMEMNRQSGRMENLIDITVEADGKSATYSIPESLSITYAGNIVLATEKAGLASEVEAQKTRAEQAMKAAERAKMVMEKAPDLLAELDPKAKADQQNEQRFSKMETTISEMEKTMRKQQEMIANFIKEFKS